MEEIQNYKIVKEISSNELVKIYQAYSNDSKSPVLLKVVDSSISSEYLESFAYSNKYDHALICPVFDSFQFQGSTCFVMEHLRGLTLKNYMKKCKRISEAEARDFFFQLIVALQYIHSNKRVAGRGIKAENIFVCVSHTIRMIEFGRPIKMASNNSGEKEINEDIAYLPPELIQGEQKYEAKSDIWSLGIILYFMLHGKLPFESDDENDNNRTAYISAVLSKTPAYSEKLSQDVVELMKSMLEKDPSKRISIDQIMIHSFFTNSQRYISNDILFFNSPEMKLYSKEFDHNIIETLQTNGLDITKLSISKKNNALVAYLILRRAEISSNFEKRNFINITSKLQSQTNRYDFIVPKVKTSLEFDTNNNMRKNKNTFSLIQKHRQFFSIGGGKMRISSNSPTQQINPTCIPILRKARRIEMIQNQAIRKANIPTIL